MYRFPDLVSGVPFSSVSLCLPSVTLSIVSVVPGDKTGKWTGVDRRLVTSIEEGRTVGRWWERTQRESRGGNYEDEVSKGDVILHLPVTDRGEEKRMRRTFVCARGCVCGDTLTCACH